MKPSLLIAALCAVLCGACSAQSYTRTVNTGVPYVERTGLGESALQVAYGSARQVLLPFDFPYFDRTYSVCWMTNQGVVKFQDNFNSGGVFNLTPPYFGGDLAGIHAFHGYLVSQNSVAPETCGVYFEPGRVVFQWRNISVENGEAMWLNFQAQILDTGEIRILWGPEILEVNVATPFVSGLVPPTPVTGVPGFGGVMIAQTARPTPGTEIVFTPTGFAQLSGVELAPMNEAHCKARVFAAGTSDNMAAAFVLNARGTGGTVTSLRLGYAVGGAGVVSLRLYRDVAPLGEFDPAVDIGLQAKFVPSTSTNFTGMSETVDGSTPKRGYFIVADVYAGPTPPLSTVSAIAVNQGDVTATSTVWGGYLSEYSPANVTHMVTTGPLIQIVNDYMFPSSPRVVVTGSTNNPVGSFALRLGRGGTTPIKVTQLGWQSTGSLNLTNFTDFRLWRDNGVLGSLNGSDEMVGEVLAPTSAFIVFAGLSELVSTSDTHYLVTCGLAGWFSSVVGTVHLSTYFPSLEASTSGAVFLGDFGFGNLNVLSAGVTTANLQRDDERSYYQFPAQPGERYVPANAFTLRTSFGVAPVTQLIFDGPTAGVSIANLWLDHGSTPGRRDSGDTLIATGVLVANTATFSSLVLPVTQVPAVLLFTVDFSAGAAAGNRQFVLQSANVFCGCATAGSSYGPTIAVGTGAGAAGVDVTTDYRGNAFTLEGLTWAHIAGVSMIGRGAGGDPAMIVWNLIDQAGGVSGASVEVLMVRDLDSNGQWDASDLVCNFAYQDMNRFWWEITGQAPGINDVTTRRDFLIFMRRSPRSLYTGTLRFIPGGLYLGTNLVWNQNERQEPITLTLKESAAPTPIPTPPSAQGRDEEASCSASECGGGVVLFAWLGVLLAAIRLQRRRA